MCAQTPNLDWLATSPHSALFSRFYAAAGVCSPTRAAYLTGRTNERDCIHFALSCDSENPAEHCSQGPGLPWSEFTTAKAVKKKGGYKSIMIGKWHLGDLWDKHKLDGREAPRKALGNDYLRGEAPWGDYSSPAQHGFDDWLQTQAEASNSMPNCGCFPKNHTHPSPRPPHAYSVKSDGDQCVVGGGFASDWAYPCTDYFYPNASDSRGVSGLHDYSGSKPNTIGHGRVPGNDAAFIVDRFLAFMTKTLASGQNFYGHLTFHAIHEPHPAMPEFWRWYKNDPDYLGALTMFDGQLGRLVQTLKERQVYNNTIIFYTADNVRDPADDLTAHIHTYIVTHTTYMIPHGDTYCTGATPG
jgi:arylsulfatase A-like enzyme